jgi:hypothetical protein
MSRIHRAIFGGLSAALIALSGPASAAPTGLGSAKPDVAMPGTLVHHHGGGFGGGFGGFHSFHGAPHFSHGPVRFSGNWNHDGHHHHHHGHGYPFVGFYGGYYPYYDSYYFDDYADDYYYGSCYYSRRLHARIYPDE